MRPKNKLLTKCIEAFKHDVPNPALNDMRTIGDVVHFFLQEQKDTSTLEDMHGRHDLPKNVHINLEYNRFDPEKDTFFKGSDAFPERSTHVPSLWYSKKYKPVIKRKEMFEK
jgi:large subunit ribosomal protein L50